MAAEVGTLGAGFNADNRVFSENGDVEEYQTALEARRANCWDPALELSLTDAALKLVQTEARILLEATLYGLAETVERLDEVKLRLIKERRRLRGGEFYLLLLVKITVADGGIDLAACEREAKDEYRAVSTKACLLADG